MNEPNNQVRENFRKHIAEQNESMKAEIERLAHNIKEMQEDKKDAILLKEQIELKEMLTSLKAQAQSMMNGEDTQIPEPDKEEHGFELKTEAEIRKENAYKKPIVIPSAETSGFRLRKQAQKESQQIKEIKPSIFTKIKKGTEMQIYNAGILRYKIDSFIENPGKLDPIRKELKDDHSPNNTFIGILGSMGCVVGGITHINSFLGEGLLMAGIVGLTTISYAGITKNNTQENLAKQANKQHEPEPEPELKKKGFFGGMKDKLGIVDEPQEANEQAEMESKPELHDAKEKLNEHIRNMDDLSSAKLRQRLACGEITLEEYEKIKKELGIGG